MTEEKLQSRYAQSLLDLAVEQGILEDIYHDVQLIMEICLQSHELQVILRNPVIKPLKKRQIITSVFEEHCKELTIKFLSLLVSKRREIHLMGICKSFVMLYRKRKGILSGEIIFAHQVKDALLEEITKTIEMELNRKIILDVKIDPSLIGGFCLTIEGQQYNASFKEKLSLIRKQFATQ